MPEFPVTLEGKPVARLSCAEEFAAVLADTVFRGGRFELTGATEKWPDKPAQLVEVLLYGFCVPAEGIEIPHWIPVSERLPEGDELTTVLGWNGVSVREVVFAPRAREDDHWSSAGGHEFITHWMPLPEPPEVK